MNKYDFYKALAEHAFEEPINTALHFTQEEGNKLVLHFAVRNSNQKITLAERAPKEELLTSISRNKPTKIEKEIHVLFKAAMYEPIKITHIKAKATEDGYNVKCIYFNTLHLQSFTSLPIFTLTIDIANKLLSMQCNYKPNYVTYCTVMNSEQEYGRFTTKIILLSKRLLSFLYEKEQIIILKCTMDFIVDMRGRVYLMDANDFEVKKDLTINPDFNKMLLNLYIKSNEPSVEMKQIPLPLKHYVASRHDSIKKPKPSTRNSCIHNERMLATQSKSIHSRDEESVLLPSQLITSIHVNIVRARKKGTIKGENRIIYDDGADISRPSVPLTEYITEATNIVKKWAQNKPNNTFNSSFRKYVIRKGPLRRSVIESTTYRPAVDEESPLYLTRMLSDRKLKKTQSYMCSIARIHTILGHIRRKARVLEGEL